MLRKLLGAGAVLAVVLAGCRGPKGSCEVNEDCGEGRTCDATVNLCFVTETPDGKACTSACSEFQACKDGSCTARFSGYTFVMPRADGAVKSGEVQLKVQLVPRADIQASPNYPASIAFTVTPKSGGAGTSGTLARDAEGFYTGAWTAPQGTSDEFDLEVRSDALAEAGKTSFRLDNEAPVFTVSVTTPLLGSDSPETIYRDPSSTNAWRRDQVVTVAVTANEAVDASSVRLSVTGIGEGTQLAPLAVTDAGVTCGQPFCGEVQVDLSKPPMKAFRGAFSFDVDGNDVAGNAGAVTKSINVTRWKWAFDGKSGAIRTTPAIGRHGVVYFGSSSDPAGKLFAISQRGEPAWPAVTTGMVSGSASVGSSGAGMDVVYVAGKPEDGTKLYAIDGQTGDVLKSCPYASGTVNAATALISTQVAGAPVESALFVVDGYGSAIALRPTSTSWDCVPSNVETDSPNASTGTLGSTLLFSSLVAEGNKFYYPTDATSLVGFTFGGTDPLFTSSTTNTQAIYGLAMLGSDLVGGGGGLTATQGGIYRIPKNSTGAGTTAPLSGTANNRVFNLIVGGTGSDGRAFYGAEKTGGSDFKGLNLAQPSSVVTAESAGAFPMAAALGSGGIVYTAGSQGTAGRVTARDAATLEEVWHGPDTAESDGFGLATGSVALDCLRDEDGAQIQNGLGLLYVPTGSKLHAVIVDSPGLDRTAPWPKHQRDARNSGNPATPMTDCQ